jgi:RHS repeat-associated protein
VFAGERAVYSRIETVTGTTVAAPEAYYLHRDHQGSVVKLTPALAEHTPGLYKTAFSFDALGQRRQVNGLAGGTAIYGENQWTDRGYTGHEHLDDVELIHMNGRVQHPGLGRFLSPDPVLGSLEDPQSLNPYSYVSNKPLVFTDPSGFDTS